jgi:hypothetical protein
MLIAVRLASQRGEGIGIRHSLELSLVSELPPLTYFSVDSLSEGVGASQVVPYVERLAQRGMTVALHSFEKVEPGSNTKRRLDAAGVRWHPHPFGPAGPAGGLLRVMRGARFLSGAELVHARSDLAAASAVVSRCRAGVWDMRALWREQRMELGQLRSGSLEERVMRGVERAAAGRSAAIITLSRAAVTVLGERFGPEVSRKSRVITTCVDLERFPVSGWRQRSDVRFLLAGTINRVYDVPAMIRFVERFRLRRPAHLHVVAPAAGPWHGDLQAAGASFASRAPDEMPSVIAAHDVGLSMLRPGASTRAAMPTKVGELLACGRPVVVSEGVGDLDDLLARYDCGVIVREGCDDQLSRATLELERLLADEETPARCRRLAEEHFDLERGIDALVDTYREALAP